MAKAYILSQVPVGYGQAMSLMVELLISAGWTYKGSGDGLSGYSVTGKIFTGSGGGALGWANNRAWARVAAPDGRREICIQHDNAAGIRLKYSSLGKFVGGSPSANTVPTATDQRVMWGAGTDASPTIQGWFNGTIPSGGCKFYGFADDVAPYGFWIGAITIPAGGPQFGMVLDPVDTVPEDPDPVVFHIGNNTHAMQRGLGMLTTANNVNYAAAWPAPGGTVSGAWAHMDPGETAFVYVMAGTYGCGYLTNDASQGGSAYIGGSNTFLLNPFNGKHETLPILWGRPAMAGLTLPNIGIKGWSKFMRWTTISRVSGLDTLDGRKWICMGWVWLPWDGVTTPTN